MNKIDIDLDSIALEMGRLMLQIMFHKEEIKKLQGVINGLHSSENNEPELDKKHREGN